jgi:hypothetical protein
MKITTTQLKQIIQEVIQEEHPLGAVLPDDMHGDRHLAYLMDNLGTLDNVAQVLELVAEDMPEFMERFQHYHDYLMS